MPLNKETKSNQKREFHVSTVNVIITDNTESSLSLSLSHSLSLSLSLSFAICPHWPSLLVSPPDRIQSPHRAYEYKILLVAQHWCVNVWESIVEHLMSSSLILHESPACLGSLSWMICEMGCRWVHNCCFVGCCFQDLFKKARSILVYFSSSFFFKCSVRIQVVQPYSSADTATAWKNYHFIFSDFHIVDSLSVSVHALSLRGMP